MRTSEESDSVSKVDKLNVIQGHRLRWKSFEGGARVLLDARCNDYLQGVDVGQDLRAFAFCSRLFPAKDLNKKEGSMLSQFLSNHLPSSFYFGRFHIPHSARHCSCLTSLMTGITCFYLFRISNNEMANSLFRE